VSEPLTPVTDKERLFVEACKDMCGYYHGWGAVLDMVAHAVAEDAERLKDVPWQDYYRARLLRDYYRARLLRAADTVRGVARWVKEDKETR
jgi:hypothetical protein